MVNDKNMLQKQTLLNSGRYEILEQLGSGGFGKTYKVKRTFDGKVFAMKEFFIKGINNRRDNTVIVSNEENVVTFQKQREKFKVEAERLRDLNNPHIIKVVDFFPDNGTFYYVMNYIEGKSLDKTTKPLSENDTWKIFDQVLDALSEVHQVKKDIDGKKRIWVHLDIKPANLMIDKNGKVTLIDFGASKQLSADSQHSSISLSQMPFTRPYAPLEQITQQVDSIGPWTDFYALGATLYALQTEKDTEIPEYSKLQDLATGKDDLENAFTFPKNMSEIMRRLIVWMMNPDRKKRPQSVSEIQSFLKPYSFSDCTTEFSESKHLLSIKTVGAEYGDTFIDPQKKQNDNGETLSCLAKPHKDCTFGGWVNTKDKTIISSSPAISIEITQDTCLTGIFSKKRTWLIVGITLISLVFPLAFFFFFIDDVSFLHMDDCHEGFIRISMLRGNINKEGFIDKKGTLIIPFSFYRAERFQEGLAAVQKDKDGKWGFINTNGEIVVDFIYNEVNSFQEGLACVKKNGKYGYIDRRGNKVIDFIYNKARSFHEGLAAVEHGKGPYEEYIDDKGNTVISQSEGYYITGDFSDGLARVCKSIWNNGKWESKYGYIDHQGNVVIDFVYEFAHDFLNGLSNAQRKDKQWGYINKSNMFIPTSDSWGLDSDDLFYVRFKENKTYYTKYINSEGETVIPPFKGIGEEFHEGLAFVRNSGNGSSVIDETGCVVIEFNNDVVSGGYSEGVAFIWWGPEGQEQRLIDKSGNTILDLNNFWDKFVLVLTNWSLEL